MGETKLGIYIDKVGDGIHGTPQYDTNGGYYFVNGSDLGNHIVILSDNTPTISKDTWDKIKKPLNATTLLLSINGTLGKVAKYNGENIALGKSVCYINLKPTIDRDYLYYVLQTPEFEYYMQNYAHGATIKNFAPCQVLDFKFSIPSIKEQQRIASILSAYDTQIENNQKRIKLLEQMAENLYKEWFVRFRFPGYETVEFEGGVPKGWNLERLEDFGITLETGSRPKGGIDGSIADGVPSLGAEAIKGLAEFDYSSQKLVTQEYYKSMKRGQNKGNHILVYKDGAYIGKVTIFRNEFPFKTYSINEHVFFLNTKDIDFQNYMYFTLHQPAFFSLMQNLNRNAAQPGLSQQDMYGIKVIKPENKVALLFNNFVEPIFNEVFDLAKQIKQLTTQRDLLLPRLMSGKLSI